MKGFSLRFFAGFFLCELCPLKDGLRHVAERFQFFNRKDRKVVRKGREEVPYINILDTILNSL